MNYYTGQYWQNPYQSYPEQNVEMGTAEEYLRRLFMRLRGQTINIIVFGQEEPYEELTVRRVREGVVIAESEERESYVIPIKDVITVIVPENLAGQL